VVSVVLSHDWLKVALFASIVLAVPSWYFAMMLAVSAGGSN
jgi:hypothetical protein